MLTLLTGRARYMIEGYDGDDVYIMVEDEFHSVAQTFTQHLHHAEYQRLKKRARATAPTTFKPNERMRVDARKKMESAALRARQRGAMGDGAGGLALVAEADEGDDDPWTGTTLAGLMTDQDDLRKTALVGLEKIPSSTRAAKKLPRGGGDGLTGQRTNFNPPVPNEGKEKASGNIEEQETKKRTDSTDARSKVRSSFSIPQKYYGDTDEGLTAEQAATPSSRVTNTERTISASKTSTAGQVSPSRLKKPSAAAHKLLENFDNFDGPDGRSILIEKASHSPLRDRKSKTASEKRKMRMSDIPTFLV